MTAGAANPKILVYDFFARDELGARSGGRRRAMRDGWVGLRVISAEPHPTIKLNNYWHVRVAATEQRGVSYHEYYNFNHINLLSRGSRVRTLAVGVNHAGGTRHEMAAGAEGEIVRREGPNVRVRFAAPAGRTFVYAPANLEVLKP